MNESAARKAKYPDLYGTSSCPGAGLTKSTSRGRSFGTIGARQGGADIRQERARLIAIIAQQSGSEPGRMRIMARRMAQGKRV